MFYSRSKLERNEEKLLSPFGMKSSSSKGRKYPDEEADYRTAFQRDRDRILHTSAFRRLEYKTQVFIIDEGDYYRTRLTHTLEVAQIGRTLARALGANEDLTESICLAHDLGHPAFGHSGEAVLSRLMKDFNGFEHNKQSYRIVTELEKRYPNFPGLNLTWEVLEGIVKHETEYDRSDAKEFNPDLRGNLEAQIANTADELAYSAHDLDDGLRSKMISTDMLAGIDLWNDITNSIGWQGEQFKDITRHRLIRRLIGLTVTDLIHATAKNIKESDINSVDELQRLPYNVVCFSEEMKRRTRQLKDFLYNNLYRHYRVMRMATKAENIITDLFEAYVAEPKMLPPHVQSWIKLHGLERTICDYISGMTDRYAIDEHIKLFNPTILP
ncbi:MAG: deoxyguanosinetriphosphate triphosphohydrolase [Anaerolineaceae bacterium]|nr:deoxyguanosinetriphosphate triphosphohydrolase [Anaerolineaceae bacterium]